MSSSPTPNYAELFGIHSVIAAFVFGGFYLLALVCFTVQGIRRLSFVYAFLVVFCAMRHAAFILRGLIAHEPSMAHNLSTLTTYQIISGVGFFGILFSAYMLAMDKLLLVETTPPSTVTKVFRNKFLFHVILSSAVALSIVGGLDLTSTDPNTVSLGGTLRKVGTGIFFASTVLLVYHTIMLVVAARRGNSTGESIGERYGHYVLLGIAICLLIREVFILATISDMAKQNDEKYWYPLVALPEVLAVILYAAPGLVPPRSKLPRTGLRWRRDHA